LTVDKVILLHPTKTVSNSNDFDSQNLPDVAVFEYKILLKGKRLFGVWTKKRPLNLLRGPLTLKTKTNLLTSETI
jgi:hypothetical protein